MHTCYSNLNGKGSDKYKSDRYETIKFDKFERSHVSLSSFIGDKLSNWFVSAAVLFIRSDINRGLTTVVSILGLLSFASFTNFVLAVFLLCLIVKLGNRKHLCNFETTCFLMYLLMSLCVVAYTIGFSKTLKKLIIRTVVIMAWQ